MPDAIEIIPHRLYWTSLETIPPETGKSHYFSVDTEFVYDAFFNDFGPLNLGMLTTYCVKLYQKLQDPALVAKRIIHVCSQDPKKRANAACLMGGFQVLVLRRPAHMAHRPFDGIEPPLKPFRDASNGPCSFHLTMKDCLDAFQFITEKQWFDWTRFSVATYEHYSQIENGDMNWIIPGKFLAFAGPSPTPYDAQGYEALTPEDYVANFQKAEIGLVVRLNKPCYDRRRFTDHGIKHVDLYFKDGSCPPRDVISAFFQATECERSAVAVHCKAGLGRTGTLIGLFAMKHHFFPARAFIAWNRICRPGSVLGPQQQFLMNMEVEMFQAGAAARGLRWSPPVEQPAQTDNTDAELAQQASNMQIRDSRNDEQRQGDAGQGERLTSAKRNQQKTLSAVTASTAVSSNCRQESYT